LPRPGRPASAGSRLLLQESIHDAFVDKLLALAKTARMGNPMSLEPRSVRLPRGRSTTRCCPTSDVARTKARNCAWAADRRPGRNAATAWFVEPTIFTGVNNRMRIAQEEVFGPVLSIIPFKDEDDAVRIANDVRFGLGAGVWTQDVGRAIRMSERIKAGTCG